MLSLLILPRSKIPMDCQEQFSVFLFMETKRRVTELPAPLVKVSFYTDFSPQHKVISQHLEMLIQCNQNLVFALSSLLVLIMVFKDVKW